MLATHLFPTAIAGVLVTAGLALAQPALATDFCVAPNDTCGGVKLQGFQAALDAAAMDSAPDRVFLGATTYTAPAQGFIYDPMNGGPIEIAGAGRSDTVIRGTSGGIRTLAVFGGPATRVHAMRIVMPPDAAGGAQALRTDGVVSDVSVVDDASEPFDARTGVVLLGSGALEDAFVGLWGTQPTTGVSLVGGGTVRRSGIDASSGIESNGGVIDRVTVGASFAGISIGHGATKVTSSRIRTSADGSVGIAGEGIDADASLEVDGVTLVGPAGAVKFGTGISADNAYAPTAALGVVLKNTIIRRYPSTLWVGATAPGHVNVAASYSDYDSSRKDVVGAGTLTETNVSYVGDQGFDDEGDFTLLPGSPLIDAGDPSTAQGLDALNAPLVTDGDGDGVARRDLGAVERPAAALVTPPAAPADTPAASSQPADAPPVIAARDTLAPALSGLRLSRKVFAVGRARTAISARSARGTRLSYTLSESAKVVIAIRRVGAKRAAGKLVRNGRAGRNALRFSGRIGAKALKAGRYRALITATDAAGNRSQRKTVRFRIAKP